MVFINIQIGISRNYAQKLGFLFRYCMYSTGQEYRNKLVHVYTCASVFLFFESGHVCICTHSFLYLKFEHMCIYVHMLFFSLSLDMCVCVHTHTHAQTHTHFFALSLDTCVYMYTNVSCPWVWTPVCVWGGVCMYVNIYVHMCFLGQVSMCMHACVYVIICTHVFLLLKSGWIISLYCRLVLEDPKLREEFELPFLFWFCLKILSFLLCG